MKDELQGKLVEILTSIQTAAGKASDFAMEQLPDIAQSYVAYGRAWLTFQVVFSLLVLIAVPFLAKMCFKNVASAQKASYSEEMQYIIPAIFQGVLMGVGGLIGFLHFMGTIGPAILVWTAPKVWLLKEIATLLK